MIDQEPPVYVDGQDPIVGYKKRVAWIEANVDKYNAHKMADLLNLKVGSIWAIARRRGIKFPPKKKLKPSGLTLEESNAIFTKYASRPIKDWGEICKEDGLFSSWKLGERSAELF